MMSFVSLPEISPEKFLLVAEEIFLSLALIKLWLNKSFSGFMYFRANAREIYLVNCSVIPAVLPFIPVKYWNTISPALRLMFLGEIVEQFCTRLVEFYLSIASHWIYSYSCNCIFYVFLSTISLVSSWDSRRDFANNVKHSWIRN